jgi:hypothetical protein
MGANSYGPFSEYWANVPWYEKIKFEPPYPWWGRIEEIATRLETIEHYLASGSKQPFIRSEQRAETHAQDLLKRMDAIEARLSAK